MPGDPILEQIVRSVRRGRGTARHFRIEAIKQWRFHKTLPLGPKYSLKSAKDEVLAEWARQEPATPSKRDHRIDDALDLLGDMHASETDDRKRDQISAVRHMLNDRANEEANR